MSNVPMTPLLELWNAVRDYEAHINRVFDSGVPDRCEFYLEKINDLVHDLHAIAREEL
jgi:hypothetical protein